MMKVEVSFRIDINSDDLQAAILKHVNEEMDTDMIADDIEIEYTVKETVVGDTTFTKVSAVITAQAHAYN